VVFYRARTTSVKAGGGGRGRFHGGVAWLVREEIAHQCTVAFKSGTYGKSEGVLWLRYDGGGGAVGHMAALYRDSSHMQAAQGMAEEGYLYGLERDVMEAKDEGWVILAGDINAWIGQEQEGHGHRQPYTVLDDKGKELRTANRMGKDLVAMMRRTGLVSVQGRRGEAERTWESPSEDSPSSEIDYILITHEMLSELEGHQVQAHYSELSDHLLLKARFKQVDGKNFMSARVAAQRVEKSSWRLNKVMLADEAVQQRVQNVADEVFGCGGDDEWSVEQWYKAYEEVQRRAAPMARCGGQVRSGAWAWFKSLGRGDTMKERESEIRQVWAAAKSERKQARREMEVQLRVLRKEKKVEVKVATAASFGGISDHIGRTKNKGSRDRLIGQLSGTSKRAKEVRAVRDEEDVVQTGAKDHLL
jgi:endonuclease/exonuclease/phosphatase family metal-dependent hydrolase